VEKNQFNKLCVAVTLAFVIVYVDIAILAVVLPSIQKTFNTNNTHILWVINSYVLARAALVFASGRVSDLLSHKRTFRIGLVFFIIASLACGLSADVNMLIIFRCLQGVSASFVFTAGMSLVTSAVAKEQRGQLIAKILSVSLLSMALAPVVGGLIAHYLSWRWVFYLNLIPGALSLLLIDSVVEPCDKKDVHEPFDWLGFLYITTFVVSVNIALQNSTHWGFLSIKCGLLFLIGIAALLLFIKQEGLTQSPLVDLRLFQQANFIAGSMIASLTQVAAWLILFLGVFFQYALHFSPLKSGYMLFPLLAVGVISANIGGWLLDTYGIKWPLRIGTGSLLLGLLITLLLFYRLNYLALLPLLLLGGMGIFMVNGPVRAAMLNQTPQCQYGMVNATLTGIRGMMGAIGFAVLSAVITGVESTVIKTKLHALLPKVSIQALQSIQGLLSHTDHSQQLLHSFSAHNQHLIYTIVFNAYVSAFFWMLVLLTGLMFISFMASIFVIRA
jgi:EmrB/QacA subfamily drug resistance transporter